jgi:hypothetical protein
VNANNLSVNPRTGIIGEKSGQGAGAEEMGMPGRPIGTLSAEVAAAHQR